MAADYILTIDYGTQGVRALLFDPRGNMVDRFHLELEPYFALEPGWAEQDPEYFWRSTCAACQGLWRQTRVPREAIAGVALTTRASRCGWRCCGSISAAPRACPPSAACGASPFAWRA
jgi:sugar (pentulose or hexulose) kinase